MIFSKESDGDIRFLIFWSKKKTLCYLHVIIIDVTLYIASISDLGPVIPSEQQLARLTDFVCFLENWPL